MEVISMFEEFIGKRVKAYVSAVYQPDGTVIGALSGRRFVVATDDGHTVVVDQFTEVYIVVPKNGWLVKLTYFKQSGKFYAEGEYRSFKTHMFEIFEEVQAMAETGKLPGLVKGCSEFIVSIDVPEHIYNHPHLCNVRGK